MKKAMLILLCVLSLLGAAGCGGNNPKAPADASSSAAPAAASSSVQNDSFPAGNTQNTANQNDGDWKAFLKEYDSFADRLIALQQKTQENPDPSVLNEYSALLSEISRWSERYDKIFQELAASPNDLAEFSAEVSRILKKLEAINPQ